MIEKETQIKILLGGDAFRFACKILGVTTMRNQDYSAVFTVSKEDIYNYVSINGIPQHASISRYSKNDGFHFFEEDGNWYTCFRERGRIYDEKLFENYETGQKYIVDTLLKLSGTGLF